MVATDNETIPSPQENKAEDADQPGQCKKNGPSQPVEQDQRPKSSLNPDAPPFQPRFCLSPNEVVATVEPAKPDPGSWADQIDHPTCIPVDFKAQSDFQSPTKGEEQPIAGQKLPLPTENKEIETNGLLAEVKQDNKENGNHAEGQLQSENVQHEQLQNHQPQNGEVKDEKVQNGDAQSGEPLDEARDNKPNNAQDQQIQKEEEKQSSSEHPSSEQSHNGQLPNGPVKDDCEKAQNDQPQDEKVQAQQLQNGKAQDEQVEEKQLQNGQAQDKQEEEKQLQNGQAQDKQEEEKQLQNGQAQEERVGDKQLQNGQAQDKPVEEEQVQNGQGQDKPVEEEQVQIGQAQNEQVEENQLQNGQAQHEQVEEEQLKNGQVEDKRVEDEQLKNEQSQADKEQDKHEQNGQLEEGQIQEAQLQNTQQLMDDMPQNKDPEAEQTTDIEAQREQLQEKSCLPTNQNGVAYEEPLQNEQNLNGDLQIKVSKNAINEKGYHQSLKANVQDPESKSKEDGKDKELVEEINMKKETNSEPDSNEQFNEGEKAKEIAVEENTVHCAEVKDEKIDNNDSNTIINEQGENISSNKEMEVISELPTVPEQGTGEITNTPEVNNNDKSSECDVKSDINEEFHQEGDKPTLEPIDTESKIENLSIETDTLKTISTAEIEKAKDNKLEGPKSDPEVIKKDETVDKANDDKVKSIAEENAKSNLKLNEEETTNDGECKNESLKENGPTENKIEPTSTVSESSKVVERTPEDNNAETCPKIESDVKDSLQNQAQSDNSKASDTSDDKKLEEHVGNDVRSELICQNIIDDIAAEPPSEISVASNDNEGSNRSSLEINPLKVVNECGSNPVKNVGKTEPENTPDKEGNAQEILQTAILDLANLSQAANVENDCKNVNHSEVIAEERKALQKVLLAAETSSPDETIENRETFANNAEKITMQSTEIDSHDSIKQDARVSCEKDEAYTTNEMLSAPAERQLIGSNDVKATSDGNAKPKEPSPDYEPVGLARETMTEESGQTLQSKPEAASEAVTCNPTEVNPAPAEVAKPKYATECVPPVRPIRSRRNNKLEVPEWRPPSQSFLSYFLQCFCIRKAKK